MGISYLSILRSFVYARQFSIQIIDWQAGKKCRQVQDVQKPEPVSDSTHQFFEATLFLSAKPAPSPKKKKSRNSFER